MRRTLARWAPVLLGLSVLLVHGLGTWLWHSANGLPDGHQNEYLHVGNALDLWTAASERDGWHVRYYLTTNYWPPLFYLWPWPLFALGGPGHSAMVLSNLSHLGILLAGVYLLGRDLGDDPVAGRRRGLWAMGVVALYPAVYGNLVRFEPNVAVLAWVTLGCWLLLRSQGFSKLRPTLAFGLVCGVGLLLDRLSLALFLALPAAVVWALGVVRGPDRGRRVALGLAALVVLVAVCGWWHWEFFSRHWAEILSQRGGEIDAAGDATELRPFFSMGNWVYYPAALLDGQAGLIPGGVALVGAGLAARHERLRLPVLVMVLCVALLTMVGKKQAYYTVPMLGCAAVVTAEVLRRGPLGAMLGAVVVFFGLHQYSLRLWDQGLPLPKAELLGAPAMPDDWVHPRHPMAKQPRYLDLPIDVIAEACEGGDVVVFSQDSTWYEGYVVLQLRERLPGHQVRGMVGDPYGTYEWFASARYVVVVTDTPSGALWPSARTLRDALRSNHYTLSDLPPVVETWGQQQEHYVQVAWWPLGHGGRAALFRSTR
jgi:hypothetical protein